MLDQLQMSLDDIPLRCKVLHALPPLQLPDESQVSAAPVPPDIMFRMHYRLWHGVTRLHVLLPVHQYCVFA